MLVSNTRPAGIIKRKKSKKNEKNKTFRLYIQEK